MIPSTKMKLLASSAPVYFCTVILFLNVCVQLAQLKWCESGHTQHLRIVILWFVASCHKRALAYMNAFSVPRHKRGKYQYVCVSTHVSGVLQFYVEWFHQLDHCHPGKQRIITHLMYSLTNSSISGDEMTMCTLPFLCDLLLMVIWTWEIYLSWSEDAPWLSAVGYVRLVHAGGFLMPGWSHPYSSTHLQHFLDSSPQRHTRTSSSSILVHGTKDSIVSRHTAVNLKGTPEGKKNLFKKGSKKLWRGLDQIMFLDLFCTHSICWRLSSAVVVVVVLDCRMDCSIIWICKHGAQWRLVVL